MTDLFTAAGQGDLHTVRTLVQTGADVNLGDSWTGQVFDLIHYVKSLACQAGPPCMQQQREGRRRW